MREPLYCISLLLKDSTGCCRTYLAGITGQIAVGYLGRQRFPCCFTFLQFFIAQSYAYTPCIYVYLDLLDFRTFTEAEGVVNAAALGRAAKPYAVFDNKLIELQQQYARQLLIEHVNPYTGLSYAQDPAVVMVEIERVLWQYGDAERSVDRCGRQYGAAGE